MNEDFGENYPALIGWGLFLISEAMPFLKKQESFNGVIHTLICLLKGSKCLAEQAILTLEPDIENGVKTQIEEEVVIIKK